MHEIMNCRVNVSKFNEEADTPHFQIEKPLKLRSEIATLDDLVRELHDVFSSSFVNSEYVSQLMSNYKSVPKHWKQYAKFDRFRYTRNLVDAGNGLFNIMVLCWGPGHASAIHDHADSHCFMKMLKGELEEVRYHWPKRIKAPSLESKADENGNTIMTDSCQITDDSCQIGSEDGYSESDQMVETARTRLEENDVCYINDTLGLHRVENPSHVEGAVSLHLYSPPFDSCRVFDARTGVASVSKVTFWSIGGKRINKSSTN